MCADANMMRLLAAEIRQELASRRASRPGRAAWGRWPVAACLLAACAVLVAAV